MLCFLRVQPPLHVHEHLFVNQRLVRRVCENDVLVVIIAPRPPGRIPAQLAGIDRVPENVFHASALEAVPAAGADAKAVEPSGKRKKPCPER
jgi:hypothetical protein